MRKRANPTLIGIFLLGAMALAFLGIIAFSSNSLFKERAEFVSSFRESVNGLAIGAKVKCQGVPIGEVIDLQLQIDLDAETFQVPIIYEIDLEKLNLVLSEDLKWTEPEALRLHIKKGLRAQLQLESIVTGQMYIELRYIDEPSLEPEILANLALNEIPTAFSRMASLSSDASGLVSNLNSLNVNAISDNLTALLVKANIMMDDLDMEAVIASILETSSSIRRLTASEDLAAAFNTIPEASDEFIETMAGIKQFVERLDSSVEVLTSQLDNTSTEMNETLQAMRQSMEQANAMLTTDAGVGYHLQETLESLTKAADALQILANSLEQNPSMFIRGKNETEQ